MLSSFGVSFEQAELYIQDRIASVSNIVSSNNRPIPASHENGQVDIVQALIDLNNDGDGWNEEGIAGVVSAYANRQIALALKQEISWIEEVNVDIANRLKQTVKEVERIESDE